MLEKNLVADQTDVMQKQPHGSHMGSNGGMAEEWRNEHASSSPLKTQYHDWLDALKVTEKREILRWHLNRGDQGDVLGSTLQS